jgi:hypothetical protein
LLLKIRRRAQGARFRVQGSNLKGAVHHHFTLRLKTDKQTIKNPLNMIRGFSIIFGLNLIHEYTLFNPHIQHQLSITNSTIRAWLIANRPSALSSWPMGRLLNASSGNGPFPDKHYPFKTSTIVIVSAFPLDGVGKVNVCKCLIRHSSNFLSFPFPPI